MSELRQEVYGVIFETWRSQVDSYWQRSNYFSVFETAALGGCWYVIEHSHKWIGLAFSIAGFLSALAWLITSVGVHRYVDYWSLLRLAPDPGWARVAFKSPNCVEHAGLLAAIRRLDRGSP